MGGNSLTTKDQRSVLTPEDAEIVEVLMVAWKEPFTTRCDFARNNAEIIAIASHHRWITTADEPSYSPQGFGSVWRITPKGLEELWQWKG